MAKPIEIVIDLNVVRQHLLYPEKSERAKLHLVTHKSNNGGIVSDATAYWYGDGSRSRILSIAGESDFYTRVRVDRQARGTQKNIDACHAAAFNEATIADLKKRAIDQSVNIAGERWIEGDLHTEVGNAMTGWDKAEHAS